MNTAQHISQSQKIQKRVRFTATAGTYYQGTGVCYDRDYGTAADSDGSRDKRVEVPSTSNNLRFAGVLDATVVVPSTGYCQVTINEPGSVCQVAVGSDTTVDVTVLNCMAGSGSPGRFRADTGTSLGRGAALALQTTTDGITGESIDGTAVVSTATVTKTGMFTGAAAGDLVVIMAGSTSGGAAGSTAAIYTISSVTSANAAVLTASPGDGDLACYVMGSNYPTVLAYLYDGPETGLIEWIPLVDNAAAQFMVSGCTHVLGGITPSTGDSIATLADGTFPGQTKAIVLSGTITTHDYLVTCTSAIQPDGTTALATLEFDAAADAVLLTWFSSKWGVINILGPAMA